MDLDGLAHEDGALLTTFPIYLRCTNFYMSNTMWVTIGHLIVSSQTIEIEARWAIGVSMEAI